MASPPGSFAGKSSRSRAAKRPRRAAAPPWAARGGGSFFRRIETGEAGDQHADEEDADELLDHDQRAGLVGDRRDVAETGRRQGGEAEIEQAEKRVGLAMPDLLRGERARREA